MSLCRRSEFASARDLSGLVRESECPGSWRGIANWLDRLNAAGHASSLKEWLLVLRGELNETAPGGPRNGSLKTMTSVCSGLRGNRIRDGDRVTPRRGVVDAGC